MENIIKRLIENHRSDLNEMANVSKSDTKLHYDIWIDSEGKDRTLKHNTPRVKVKVDGKTVSISISENPKILAGKDFRHSAEVLKWISKYHDILMQHWNKEITDREALNLLAD